MFSFYATTNRGLEDVAAREVEELLGVKASVGLGRVFFESSLKGAIKLNLASRMLHRVVLILVRSTIESLEEVYRTAAAVDYPSFIEPAQSFAVRAERKGKHSFTSLDVASKVGQAVIDTYMALKGSRLKVNLDDPDVVIQCMLKENDFTLGIDLTGPSLHMRNYRVYDHPAALRSTIAASMLKLSGWQDTAPLLDPMCGGGTIVIEAALMARKVPPGIYRKTFAYRKLCFIDKELEAVVAEDLAEGINFEAYPIHGLDCSAKHVQGAMLNARSAGVDDTIKLEVGDALRLREILDYQPAYLVLNPPYGVRSGPSLKRIADFYLKLLRSLKEAARGARVTLITASYDSFLKAASKVGVEVLWSRSVMHGSLKARIASFLL